MGEINWFSVVLTNKISRPQNAGRLERRVRPSIPKLLLSTLVERFFEFARKGRCFFCGFACNFGRVLKSRWSVSLCGAYPTYKCSPYPAADCKYEI